MTAPSMTDEKAAVSAAPWRLLLGHLGVAALLAFVLSSMLPPLATASWTGAVVATGAAEAFANWIARERQSRGWRAAAVAATALTSALYAAIFGALMAKGDPGAKLFSLVLITCSMTFVLLRYHSRPWSFVIAILPQIGMLMLLGAVMAAGPLKNGHLLPALMPIATYALLILTFWAARNELADAWKAIVAREQAAAAANRAKSAFLATMSHEIRTPLNGVLGMAQAMTIDDLAEAQRERLKVIRRSGESLLAILDDVLDLSRIESGRLELEESEFDLEHLVRGAAANFAPQARHNGVTFRLDIHEDAKGSWRGDRTRVRQVLYHLASNAVKFTHAGEVSISVNRTDAGLAIAVSDTGIGIAAEDLPTLFDKFVQKDSSFTRRYGGAGLGLTISHELVSLMGGQIEVESEPGRGSTFTVTLPLEKASDTAPAPQPAPEPVASAEGRPLRVLAAEDNAVNQMVLKTLLAQAGIEPVIVENGALAVETWRREPWDIILMDIQMPEMDGVAATRAIRACEAETMRERTPILAVTANAMVHQVAEYRAAGMDGLAPKPLEIQALFGALEAALDGREAWSLAA